MSHNSPPLTFLQKLQGRWAEGYFVCVGLDPRWENLPRSLIEEVMQKLGLDGSYEKLSSEDKWQVAAEAFRRFNCAIVDATHHTALAYKPNIAFYEALGAAGYEALRRTIAYIRLVAPTVVIILDCKRQDIGSTNEAYVEANYGYLDADAFTAHPYLGVNPEDAFLRDPSKTPIYMCRTSNDEAPELQDLVTYEPGAFDTVPKLEPVVVSNKEQDSAKLYAAVRELRGQVNVLQGWISSHQERSRRLFERVAEYAAARWNKHGNCALVVGATYPGEGAIVRKIVGDMPLLIPGIGAQGGDLEGAVRSCMDSRGWGMIVNSSRGIIFACKDRSQPLAVFAECARVEAERLTREIDAFRMKHLALSGAKAELADALHAAGAVKFGEFSLKLHETHPDAPKSPHYFNLRVPENGGGPLTSALVAKIGVALLNLAADIEPSAHAAWTHLVGLPKAGDPFATVMSEVTGKPRLQLVKESDGERRWIDRVENEDEVPIGGTALVVDDLVTGEGTKLEGVRVLQDAGVHVTDILVLIDRRPGSAGKLAAEGLCLHSVYTQAELLNHYLATGRITYAQHARCHLYNDALSAFLGNAG